MCDAHRPIEQTSTAAVPASGITFHVPDMTCGHCAGTIRSAFEKNLPGTEVAIDVSSSRVTVSGEEDAAAQIIRTAGYTPERVSQ